MSICRTTISRSRRKNSTHCVRLDLLNILTRTKCPVSESQSECYCPEFHVGFSDKVVGSTNVGKMPTHPPHRSLFSILERSRAMMSRLLAIKEGLYGDEGRRTAADNQQLERTNNLSPKRDCCWKATHHSHLLWL
jgi:hypothetical protein